MGASALKLGLSNLYAQALRAPPTWLYLKSIWDSPTLPTAQDPLSASWSSPHPTHGLGVQLSPSGALGPWLSNATAVWVSSSPAISREFLVIVTSQKNLACNIFSKNRLQSVKAKSFSAEHMIFVQPGNQANDCHINEQLLWCDGWAFDEWLWITEFFSFRLIIVVDTTANLSNSYTYYTAILITLTNYLARMPVSLKVCLLICWACF